MPNKLLGALLAILSLSAQAETVVCHLNYGGATSHIEAQPSTTPYAVAATPVGSYFLFRIVFRQEPADLANIKLYTYADRESGPLLIHQASYAYPLGTTADPANILRGTVNGFTGLNFVYEPLRDGELQYWCELNTEAAK